MRQNRVKRIMREGGLAIVSHVGFADPAVSEACIADATLRRPMRLGGIKGQPPLPSETIPPVPGPPPTA